MKTIPPAARAAFQAALRPLTVHVAALPDPLPLGRILFLRDPEKTGGDSTRIVTGQDERGYYLDYFRRDEHSAWHGRIREDGKDEDLENYEGQFGTKAFPDPADTERERQRVYAHNEQVRALLRKKGFED
jgi:hypothetical protein